MLLVIRVGVEPTTSWSVVKRSFQLNYRTMTFQIEFLIIPTCQRTFFVSQHYNIIDIIKNLTNYFKFFFMFFIFFRAGYQSRTDTSSSDGRFWVCCVYQFHQSCMSHWVEGRTRTGTIMFCRHSPYSISGTSTYERNMGIEPTSQPWKGRVLPLH